jgi:phosphatidylserine/phosphatidylglycerophosphate/cardiolipin synthase-like enzyme
MWKQDTTSLEVLHRLGFMPLPGIRTTFAALVVVALIGSTGNRASGQAATPLCAKETHAVAFYAPKTNLERRELETLRTAKVSVDVAMYSFTDLELAAELVALARSGVRVRVYRDSRESANESQRGITTTSLLLAGGVGVRVKASRDLMHFKSYLIDGTFLRTGSANWSPTGLKRQDNDVHYESDPTTAKAFEAHFATMWERSTNRVPMATQTQLE